jgi:hypothetical protein
VASDFLDYAENEQFLKKNIITSDKHGSTITIIPIPTVS